jgi:hypothetical protein
MVRAAVRVVSASGSSSVREVSVASRATVTVSNVAGTAGSPVAHVVVTPLEGELAVTARSGSTSGGTAIPVLSAAAGLRLGQSHLFSDLDDATARHTSYGLVETSGLPATAHAEIVFSEGSALVTAVTSRTFALGPFEQVYLPELVRSFAGSARDGLGDLHDLTLQITVTGGDGSVVPFVISSDVSSGDTSLSLP